MALIEKLTDTADAIREKKNVPEVYDEITIWNYDNHEFNSISGSGFHEYTWTQNDVCRFRITIYDIQFNDECLEQITRLTLKIDNTIVATLYKGEEYNYPYIINSTATGKNVYVTAGNDGINPTPGAEVIAHYKIEPCDSDGNVLYETYTPAQMAEEIRELPEGLTDEELTFSGNLDYWDYYGKWDWFIEKYGDRIKTSGITSMNSTFYNSPLEKIPFEINMFSSDSRLHSITYAFKNMQYLTELPKINNNFTVGDIEEMLANCYRLREIPEDFGDDWNWERYQSETSSYSGYLVSSCYSLRKFPTNFLTNITTTMRTSVYSNCYYSSFIYCCSLDELVGMNITSAVWQSNMFVSTLLYCYRLKDFIFLTNEDGTAKTASWKSQTIDLSGYIGYASNSSKILNYNSGITADKEVTDDESYQALKDDPDWFTCKADYSRYNHDSAARTINSLPDTSEYLATAGGTNTIKFKGQLGALTDGGAINTLTEEEIAVATAKGWTVTLV